LPYEDIVCLMTDCVWGASLPEWLKDEDTGKPGISSPWRWPRSSAEMRSEAINRNRNYLDKLGEKEQP
jgi:hypothetical protein